MNPHLCSHSHITALAVYAVRNQLPGVVGLLSRELVARYRNAGQVVPADLQIEAVAERLYSANVAALHDGEEHPPFQLSDAALHADLAPLQILRAAQTYACRVDHRSPLVRAIEIHALRSLLPRFDATESAIPQLD